MPGYGLLPVPWHPTKAMAGRILRLCVIRLIQAVDVDSSGFGFGDDDLFSLAGTLDFNEFISLLIVYRQTDGFSHKERPEDVAQ